MQLGPPLEGYFDGVPLTNLSGLTTLEVFGGKGEQELAFILLWPAMLIMHYAVHSHNVADIRLIGLKLQMLVQDSPGVCPISTSQSACEAYVLHCSATTVFICCTCIMSDDVRGADLRGHLNQNWSANWPNLQYLYVGNTSITGSIPQRWFDPGIWIELTYLAIVNSKLQGQCCARYITFIISSHSSPLRLL